MKHRWKRYLSGLLCLLMVLSVLPVSAIAESIKASGTCGESLTSLGSRAFVSCNALTDVYYGGTAEQWASITIDSDNAPLLAARLHFGEKAPHEFVTEAVAPACTEQGYTKHSCTGCDLYYKEDYVDAPGHTYSVQVVEPTADTDGYTRYTCMIRGEGVCWRLTEAGALVIFSNGTMWCILLWAAPICDTGYSSRTNIACYAGVRMGFSICGSGGYRTPRLC